MSDKKTRYKAKPEKVFECLINRLLSFEDLLMDLTLVIIPNLSP